MSTMQTRNGIHLCYTDWPGHRPLLFSHSWALNGDVWNYQIPSLTERGFRCVTFDRRGHGRSDRPGNGYDLDTFADDLADLIEHLDLSDLVLVGHSFGCSEIVRYLTRHGSARVSGIVLTSPTLPFLEQTEDNPQGLTPGMLAASRALIRRDVGAWIDAYPGDYFSVEHDVSEGLTDWTRRQIIDTPLQILLATMGPFDMRAELPTLTVPTLIVHGTDDLSAPIELTGHRAAELIPHSRLIAYEGAGHGLYASRSEQFNEELVAFRTSPGTKGW